MMKIQRLITQNILGVLALALLGNTLAQAQAVHPERLEQREGLSYKKGSDELYSGKVEDPGQMIGQVEEGRRVGQWKGWYPNGQLNWVFEYEEGKLTHRTIWHANGAKRMEGGFVDGRPDGVFPRWDEAGQKISEEIYRQGKLDGERRLWDPEGHLLQVAQYKDDHLQGSSTWFYADGQKRWETHYEAGERTGTWTQWTKKGEVVMQSEWDNGTLVKRVNPHANH